MKAHINEIRAQAELTDSMGGEHRQSPTDHCLPPTARRSPSSLHRQNCR